MAKTATLPPDLRTVGGRLRWAREKCGFKSIRAAAYNFGWNENTYKSHEQGIRQAEGLKEAHVLKYARAFKVNPAWLSLGVGSPEEKETTEGQALTRAEQRLLATLLAKIQEP